MQAEIATLAEAGRLTTAWRPKIGGELTAIPEPWWRTEQLSDRFGLCHLDPDHPFKGQSNETSFCWIFVNRDSLKKSLATISRRRGLEQSSTEKIPDIKPVRVNTKELESRYLERVAAYVGRTPPSRSEDEAWLKETYRLGRTRSRELRKKLAPADWHKAGARKKKKPK